MTKKAKVLIIVFIILIIGILASGIYLYSRYQRLSHLEVFNFDAEDYEEIVGKGIFKNKGIASIEKAKSSCERVVIFGVEGSRCKYKTEYAFRVYLEGVNTPSILIKDSLASLDKYLGRFVILTYSKERVIDHYNDVQCEIGPCEPEPVYVTLAVIKDIREVAVLEEQKTQIEQETKSP